MMERTLGTRARGSKGRIAPPLPDGLIATVAETIATWPGVVATAHWYLYDSSRIDGIDFYIGEDELGHIPLEGGSISPPIPLSASRSATGLAQRFPYAKGWVQQQIEQVGAAPAIELFRRNYERFAGAE